MADTAVCWEGLHFRPTERKVTGSFYQISKHLKSTGSAKLSTYNNGKWDYDRFYYLAEKAGISRTTDTFICEEDEREYIPGTNEMFLYLA